MKKNIDFEISDNGCFLITSHRPTDTGHVQFFINGKKKSISRHMYEECFGEIGDGEFLKQSCENKNCINPEHMYIASKNNYSTKVNKGTGKPIEFEINDNGCFIITSHVQAGTTGHTQFFKNGRKEHIHRHIYEECFGQIPEGYVIRHTCDNGRCTNPEHLILGTQSENVRDCINRGRHPMSKLNDKKVAEIKIKLSNGEKPIDLSLQYGVSEQTILSIRRGKTWKHVIV